MELRESCLIQLHIVLCFKIEVDMKKALGRESQSSLKGYRNIETNG